MELNQSDFRLTKDQQLAIDQMFSALKDEDSKGIVDSNRVVCVTFGFSSRGSPVSANILMRFDDGDARYAEVRPFAHTDVSLTEDQLREINLHFNGGLRSVQAREGLYSELSSNVTLETLRLWVTFEFGPGWRAIEAAFGDFDEMESQCLVYQPEPWSNSSSTFTPN